MAGAKLVRATGGQSRDDCKSEDMWEKLKLTPDATQKMPAPDVAYHGTPINNKTSIIDKGILREGRAGTHMCVNFHTLLNYNKNHRKNELVLPNKTKKNE